MTNNFKVTTDRLDTYLLLADASGSMEPYSEKVKKGIKGLREKLVNFSEADSILLCFSYFNDYYKSGAFKSVSNFSANNYYAYGQTAMYDAIKYAIMDYEAFIKKILKEHKIMPRARIIVMSDGETNADSFTDFDDAQKAVKYANKIGIETTFVPFGYAELNDLAKGLGFKCIWNLNNMDDIDKFFSEKISNSIKVQSHSNKNLGSRFMDDNLTDDASFFSKVNRNSNSSKKYSQRSKQVLEGESWFDDI